MSIEENKSVRFVLENKVISDTGVVYATGCRTIPPLAPRVLGEQLLHDGFSMTYRTHAYDIVAMNVDGKITDVSMTSLIPEPLPARYVQTLRWIRAHFFQGNRYIPAIWEG